jgi:hypothetical protein
MEWDENTVGKWLREHGLEEWAPAFEDNKIRGKDLKEVISDEDTLVGEE